MVCGRSMSMVRATNEASAPRARLTGLKGRPRAPEGEDLVRLPSSLVGENCPLVRP